ncbi:DUF4955 domain-containing protein [Labilibacter sediminis]|nr:DUF4955 domain-containing protein [Labilibacter sediminis]
MIKLTLLVLILFCSTFLFAVEYENIETFEGHNCPDAGYNEDAFKSTSNDYWWSYVDCRNATGTYAITGESLLLDKYDGRISSSQIKGGISSLSFDMNNCWTTAQGLREFEANIYSEEDGVHTFAFSRSGTATGDTTIVIENINIEGFFSIEIKNTTTTTAIVIDNIKWNSYNNVTAWTPQIWNSYTMDRTSSTLYDFSYAGYKSGEDTIPYVAAKAYITDFGGVANDSIDDTQALQDAIDAVSALGGGAVLLPKGKFIFNSLGTNDGFVTIPSDVVIRGSGNGVDGTILFLSEYITSDYGKSLLCAEDLRVNTIVTPYAYVSSTSPKGGNEVYVASTSPFTAGDNIRVQMLNPEENGVRQNTLSLALVSPLVPEEGWTNFTKFDPFLAMFEIEKVVNDTTLQLKQPLMYDFTTEWGSRLVRCNFAENIGIENLRIQSAFAGGYSHHKNWEVDYGWSAIEFTNVKNGWIRDVVIEDMTLDITLKSSMNITVEDVIVKGLDGHSGPRATDSNFCLFRNSYMQAGRTHTLGLSGKSYGNVFTNIMVEPKNGSLDIHGGGFSSHNLFEKINNCNENSGGAAENMPHSGHYNVHWNMIGSIATFYNAPQYEFFSGYWNYADQIQARGGAFSHECYKLYPKSILVGLYHNHASINVDELNTDRDNEWIYIEGFNDEGVTPASLYDAQYERRMEFYPPVETQELVQSDTIYQDFETFSNLNSAYHNGSFIAQDSSKWTYINARSSTVVLNGQKSIMLANNAGQVTSSLIQGGLSTIKFMAQQAWTGGSSNRSLTVLVESTNGIELKSYILDYEAVSALPYKDTTFVITDIDVPHDCKVSVINNSPSQCEIVIDDIYLEKPVVTYPADTIYEDFEKFSNENTSYHDGTFIAQNDSVWSYIKARSSSVVLNGQKSIMLANNWGQFTTSVIKDRISKIEFKAQQAWTGGSSNRLITVLVENLAGAELRSYVLEYEAVSTLPFKDTTFVISDIDVTEDSRVTIINKSPGSCEIVIDDFYIQKQPDPIVEDFEKFSNANTAYHDGTFEAQNDSTWSYINARSSSVVLNGQKSIMLANNWGQFTTSVIKDRISKIEFKAQQAWTSGLSNRLITVLIENLAGVELESYILEYEAVSALPFKDTTFVISDINVTEDCRVTIINKSPSQCEIVIDDISIERIISDNIPSGVNARSATGITKYETENPIEICTASNNIVVKSQSLGDVFIYDISGRLIKQVKLTSDYANIPIYSVQGLLIVKVADGQTVETKKVILRNY